MTYTADEVVLNRNHQHYWAAFAQTGVPTPDAITTLAWPAFSWEGGKQDLFFATPADTIRTDEYHQCAFWDSVGCARGRIECPGEGGTQSGRRAPCRYNYEGGRRRRGL